MTANESSSPNLTRPRKHLYIRGGIEYIKKDLECCGREFRTAYEVNEHYRKNHQDIPLSDPCTWPLVHIKDTLKHAALNLQIAYIPFPPAQPKTSTWTVHQSPRHVTGDRPERERKRALAKDSSLKIRLLREQIIELEDTVSDLQRSKMEDLKRWRDNSNKEQKKRKEIEAERNHLQLQLDILRSNSGDQSAIHRDAHSDNSMVALLEEALLAESAVVDELRAQLARHKVTA